MKLLRLVFKAINALLRLFGNLRFLCSMAFGLSILNRVTGSIVESWVWAFFGMLLLCALEISDAIKNNKPVHLNIDHVTLNSSGDNDVQ